MRDLILALFRQRRVFIRTAVLVLVIAVLYAVFGTKYESEMKVLVRRGRADAPVSAETNAPIDLTRISISDEELNSEVELLRDDEVLRRVVELSGMGGRDWFHVFHLGEGQSARVERAARRLGKKLKIEPVKKTNLITISYAADDPAVAAKVLRTLADVYLEKHTAVHRPTGEFRFFEQQTEQSRRELEESKRQLLEFASGHGVIEAAQQRDLALQKLSELDAGVRQTKIELAETQQRIGELEGLVARLPERIETQVRTADNPELLRALKSNLLDLQLKRTQLLDKFEPNHRLVQEVELQIAQTQAAIAAENAAPVRDETTDRNSRYEWASAELQKAQVELKALRARERAAVVQQTDDRAATAKLGEFAVTQDQLEGTEKAAQENYLLYVKKQEEARLNDALDEQRIVNAVIAEQPVAPALPVNSAWMVFAFGLAGAGVMATGAALAADRLEPGFRDPDDVLIFLNCPVLASLPGGSSLLEEGEMQ